MSTIEYLSEQLAYARWSLERYQSLNMGAGAIALQQRLIARLERKLTALTTR